MEENKCAHEEIVEAMAAEQKHLMKTFPAAEAVIYAAGVFFCKECGEWVDTTAER